MSGFDDLAGDLADIADNTGDQISAVVTKTVFGIQADAQAFTPVDTGNLRSSISTDVETGGASASAEVGPTAEYAQFVETGTSTQAPQPFLRPATERHLPGFYAALEQLGVT